MHEPIRQPDVRVRDSNDLSILPRLCLPTDEVISPEDVLDRAQRVFCQSEFI